MNPRVLIVGGGGHAKVLIECLRLRSITIQGILDANPDMIGNTVSDVPVIGDDDAVSRYAPGTIYLVNAIGSIGVPTLRKRVFEAFKRKGFCFATVIHPSAVVASNVVLEEGAQIMAGAVIQPGSTIGRNTIINTKASVDHDCIIGDHVHIAPGVTLSGHVLVKEVVHIGSGATVIQGVTICSNCVVGAGSVVVHDVSEKTNVMGVPAKRTKTKNSSPGR